MCFVGDRAWLSSQLAGRGDGAERFRDTANFDCLSVAEVARPDPSSEGCCDDAAFEGRAGGEEG